MRTRLELVIRQGKIKPARLAREAGYTRQHLHRLREGEVPATKRARTWVTAAIHELLADDIQADAVFEPLSREHAAVLVKEALASHRRLKDIRTAVSSAGSSESVVCALLATGRTELDRRPKRSERLYEIAAEAISRLSATPSLLVLSLRGHAEIGRASALRMLGKYEEALDVLIDAEQHFLDAKYCPSEIGNVRYARAVILFKMERWTEAAQSAAQARHIFEEAHDRRGIFRARMVLGCIATERGELDAAKRTFLDLLRWAETRGDRDTTARLWQNLATCELRRGSSADARHWLERAIRTFTELQNQAEIARSRWCEAEIMLLEKNRALGQTQLRSVMQTFDELNMPVEAGFAGLDLLKEIVGDLGKNEEAVHLARRLIEIFVRAGARISAANALSYLREAVARRAVSPELVTYVRSYVRRSCVYDSEIFRPPAGGQAMPT